MRKPIIAGNWKMHLTMAQAHALVRQLLGVCEMEAVDVVVCPPFTTLSSVAPLLKGSALALGAQDLFWETQGAFTGEISPTMLVDAGCRYVIIGHSERRQLFGETDDTVRQKLAAALAHGLAPIVCIGETLAEREAGKTFDVVGRQLAGALQGVQAERLAHLILAYEPVWAIGTGRNATPEQAQEVHQFIRQRLVSIEGRLSQTVRIQYGGSVTATNAASLLQQPDIDGALVGGASLKAEAFTAIVKAASEAKAAMR